MAWRGSVWQRKDYFYFDMVRLGTTRQGMVWRSKARFIYSG